MKNPCVQDCPRRTATCHADCPDYAKYAAWRKEQRQAKHEWQAMQSALNHGKHKKWYIDQWNQRHGK